MARRNKLMKFTELLTFPNVYENFDPKTEELVLHPDTSVKMKSNWADNRLLLNLTGFFNEYENQQITVGRTVDNQPTADLINAQEAELWGIEGEIRWVPAEGWNLMATFGWIDGDYEEFSVLDTSTDAITGEPIITPRDLSDSKVVRGPDYTYSLSVSYSHYFDGGAELMTQVGWSERGRSYNTLDTVDSSKQDSYGLMDARITYIFFQSPAASKAPAAR